MGSANERRRYYVTPSIIGWAHTQNDPWITCGLWTEISAEADFVKSQDMQDPRWVIYLRCHMISLRTITQASISLTHETELECAIFFYKKTQKT